jgi:hypothetical protein
MKHTLTLNDGTKRKITPHANGERASATGACPVCGAVAPPGGDSFPVAGTGKSIDPDNRHDTYRADAVCLLCDAHVGVIRAKVDTLFGIEEDEAVMRLGVRIYG